MRLSSVFRCPFAALGLTLLAGCGEPTTPTARTSLPLTAAADEIPATQTLSSGMIVKRTVTLTADISASTTVTPEGGWLEIPDAGLLMYFPRGAVTSDLTVTATAHNGNKVVYTFEPHGTVFNTPIYVAQLIRYTELNAPHKAHRANPWAGYLPDGLADVTADGTGYFQEVFGADYYGKGHEIYAVFTTTHFSGYALASGRCNNPNNPGQ